jgi:hypothetical protein
MTRELISQIRERCKQAIADNEWHEKVYGCKAYYLVTKDIPALLSALDAKNSVNSAYSATIDLKNIEYCELKADRDRWKTRAEALERAVKSDGIDAECETCLHFTSWSEDDPCKKEI